MPSLTTEKRERTMIRSSFTKTTKKIDELLNQKPPLPDSKDKIEALFEILGARYDELNNKNSIISTLLIEVEQVEDSALEAEQEKIDEYMQEYFRVKIAVENLISPTNRDKFESSNASCASSSPSSSRSKYKLPTLKLKEFNGDLKEFMPFWSQFRKIDEDPQLDDVDKLGYLTMSMTPGSPARDLVDSYPATREMYPLVVKALKERFGREDLLTEFYIREMLKLILQNTTSHEKLAVAVLYDRLQCHLRNLEALGVSADNCAPILMPLVSSCLPDEMLQIWERSSVPQLKSSTPTATSKDFLVNLLSFLESEVQGAQKVDMARSGFGISGQNRSSVSKSSGQKKLPQQAIDSKECATAAGLLNASGGKGGTYCVFCSADHRSKDCKRIWNLTLEERRERVNASRACFCCLVVGHPAVRCRNRPKCPRCSKTHFEFMCSQTPQDSKPKNNQDTSTYNAAVTAAKSEALASTANHCNVLMQTLLVLVRGKDNQFKKARLLIDSGSQRSYVLSSTVAEMGYTPEGKEYIQHSLFGGAKTDAVDHGVFRLHVSRPDLSYNCNFIVLDQKKICGKISTISEGPWMQELAAENIELSDVGSPADIEILVGADVAAKLWTGRRMSLSSGLVAMETKLGWTLSGKISDSPISRYDTLATVVTTMLNREATLTDLWTLDTLGITDPSERMCRAEVEEATQQHFLDSVSINEEGRFEIHLPWVERHPVLPDNYQLSLKRLQNTLKKLKNDGYYKAYQGVFDEWLHEGVIELVPKEELKEACHYLPHRHVLKPGSTTPVRPVFDASAKENKQPSLNDCLEKGLNLIEKIPSCLGRFRKRKIGVVGDIRRAFLQISVCKKDRNYLRFLWIDTNGVLKIYRHCRVVFGVSPSPFLLESCIKLHLNTKIEQCKEGQSKWPVTLVELLSESFYVDNCLTSLDDEEQIDKFVESASSIMKERHFELRGWERTGELCYDKPTNVLGLLWNKAEDTLLINIESLLSLNYEKVTKRVILSAAHRIFDPIGVTSSIALIPKLLVQQTWELGLSWEEEVSADIKDRFLSWMEEVPSLTQIQLPRWVSGCNEPGDHWTLHIFSDACRTSYAAAAFLRVEHQGETTVQLVAAKARVAPTAKPNKRMTIPRLELLGASIAARLYTTIVEDYGLQGIKTFFWTDATTVLAWIQRSEPWDIFVMNRIKEIRTLTTGCDWRHVPGSLNPADLPSRGSTVKKLIQCRWWEGPSWLKESPDYWPQQEIIFDEREINIEQKKTIVSSMTCESDSLQRDWYYRYFSQYKKIVRMVGWLYRFQANCQTGKDKRVHGDLTTREFEEAEWKVLQWVQEEQFTDVLDPKLKSLLPFVDREGLIRLMTKISNRQDARDFCHPIVLPSADHPIVHRLIMDVHRDNCHAGTQVLLSILRQRFWIIGGRLTIRSVLNTCIACKRHTAKKLEAIPAPLPESRVRDARIFEVTGVDLAGPLYLKTEQGGTTKAWVCLFTCGVYRAVRLELVSSLSTDSFLQAFRRFCSKQGRPEIVYSDQGTNFIGFDNVCDKLDWNAISQYSSARRIDWRFNPPASPWWGGWWERLVGLLKKLLRRVLGHSSVNFEEMLTILCDCETVINSRPLTYLSDDPTDLAALTPNMFLHDLEEIGMPDYDLIEAADLRKRLQYRHKLKMSIRQRFRTEYLGQLQLYANKKKQRDVKLGEIVLIGNDDSKRIDWPLARVVELIRGNDGNVRIVRVVTRSGELVRPVQRIYPLELEIHPDDSNPAAGERLRQDLVVDTRQVQPYVAEDMADPLADVLNPDNSNNSQIGEPLLTRRGRLIQKPKRLDL